MKKRWIGTAFSALALGGCATTRAAPAPEAPAAVETPVISVRGETAPTLQSGANAAVLALRDDLAQSLVIASGEGAGVEIYGLDGVRRGAFEAGDVAGLDIRYGVPFAGRAATILVALDAQSNALRILELNGETLSDIGARATPIGFAGESLCLWRDPRGGALHAFALGGHGEIAQFMIFDAGAGRMDARLVRHLKTASEAAYCAADDATGDFFVTEQGVGVWRFSADPETETVPTLIDARRLGAIEEETGGVAVFDKYLIVSNASANTLNVYDRTNDYARISAVSLAANGEIDGVEAAGGLYATTLALPGFPYGVLIAADDDNEGGPTNYKLVSIADIASALNLEIGAARDPRFFTPSEFPVVRATIETAPVETDGDAADDPAIWVNPANPAQSLIIGTQKQSGLYVYDLSGQVVQFLPDGRMNNVDLRYDFPLSGSRVALVAASNRTSDSISLYRVDPRARRLIDVADGVQPTGFIDPYGLCMYKSPRDGAFYVFVTDTEGAMRQWRLTDAGGGRVEAALVREFSFSSQTEGCVADDASGALYVAEEDVGLWRLNAEPDGGAARTSVTTVAGNPALKDDLEGVSLYDLGNGRGYLVLSSQGNNTYALFDRQGANRYLGSFAVVSNDAAGIDGVSETDGLDVTSANLGPAFPHGAFIAQDGRNVSPPDNQNFKLVPWEAIAGALNLERR